MKILVILMSFLTLGAVGWGMNLALHSPSFRVNSVELSFLSSIPPVDEGELLALASVPIGQISLFDLDLVPIRQRLLSNEWIKDVTLEKKFPHTLVVRLKFREPMAVFQAQNGGLAYVDTEGTVFGKVSLKENRDLPFLTGFSKKGGAEKLGNGLMLLRMWQSAKLDELSFLSSVTWEPDRGYRLLVAYPLTGWISNSRIDPRGQARITVDLGEELDSTLEGRLFRISNVLHYLGRKSIVSRYIRADVGKKLVVKTVHDS